MDGFSLFDEVQKQSLTVAGLALLAALSYLIGIWQKQREMREKYVTETLVKAYSDLHDVLRREEPLILRHGSMRDYAAKTEDAIRDIQLLANKECAEMAQQVGMNIALLSDDVFMRKFFVTLRKSLRSRLGLKPVDGFPSFVRFIDQSAVGKCDDALLQQASQHYELDLVQMKHRYRETATTFGSNSWDAPESRRCCCCTDEAADPKPSTEA